MDLRDFGWLIIGIMIGMTLTLWLLILLNNVTKGRSLNDQRGSGGAAEETRRNHT